MADLNAFNQFDQTPEPAPAAPSPYNAPAGAGNTDPLMQDKARSLADANRRELLGQFGRDIWTEIEAKVPQAPDGVVYDPEAQDREQAQTRMPTVFENLGIAQTGRSIGDTMSSYGGTLQQMGETAQRATTPVERSEILDLPSRLGTLRRGAHDYNTGSVEAGRSLEIERQDIYRGPAACHSQRFYQDR